MGENVDVPNCNTELPHLYSREYIYFIFVKTHDIIIDIYSDRFLNKPSVKPIQENLSFYHV